jgi:hypothetical protein
MNVNFTVALKYDDLMNAVEKLRQLAEAMGAATQEDTIGQVGDVSTGGAQLETGTSVELDKAGLPWDARIHSGGKDRILVKTGCWKLKRGVSPTLVAEVEAELRAAMAVPAAVITLADLQARLAATPVEPIVLNGVLTLYGLTSIEQLASMPDFIPVVYEKLFSVEPVAPPVNKTFPELMADITAAQIPHETVTAACVQVGLASTPLLAARPDLVSQVWTILFPEG